VSRPCSSAPCRAAFLGPDHRQVADTAKEKEGNNQRTENLNDGQGRLVPSTLNTSLPG
jgi:hypothetical protein